MADLEAASRPGVSLRARLLLLAALSTAVVVGGTTYLLERIIEKAVENEAVEAAAASALGVAAELTEREGLPSQAGLDEILADFTRAVPALRGLTVVRADAEGVAVHASTDSRAPMGVRRLSREAIDKREPVVSDPLPGLIRLVAVPLERDHHPYGAVVVSISMEAVERVRSQTRTTALIFAPLATLALTAFIGVLARGLVHRPLEEILGTMRRASTGDLHARAAQLRRDELGAVAGGLNAMLARVADFNAALQREVDGATEQLRERNRQLEESAQGLFAARHELARSEQLAVAGQMAASVAHQIGTPLNLISGYVQMIQQELPPGSTAAARLRTVQEQIGRVTTIVQGLLDQARRLALQKRPVPPDALVESACELARPALEARRIALTRAVPAGLPPVDVDEGQMEQVFLNLFTNSIDAMPEGGTLQVAAAASGASVEFTVMDTGDGIDERHLPHVFDPLFTTKAPGRGTGLGLTVVREVLAAHGGTVSIASLPGLGTSVTLRLPLAAAAQEAHA
ncbi:MAG TPA: ATP-binding protein [Vicinamibacteria bacterium]|jgi:signal transduction histidine kinase|nr:ATP-binding protein [Vicinamibacteria bacterium]